MDPTDLGGPALARPAIGLLGSTLCVAWSQASADVALPTINVASGLPPASGQWAPTITPLTLHSPDDVGLAFFKGKLWLGFAGSDSSVHLATSPDGVNFGPGIDYPGPVAAGVSLAADVERLYVAWTEAGTGKVVIASSANGVSFDTIVKLGITSGYTPALALYKHVFFGPRVCLVWADDTRRLRISSAPRYDLNRLQDAPLQLGQTTRAAPSVYAYSPLYEPEDRLLIGHLDQTGSLPSLVSTTSDMTTFSPPDFDSGVNGNSAPSVVYDSGTLRMAYAGPVDWTIKVGDRDRVFRIPDDLRALVDKNQECDSRKCTPDPRLVCIVGNEDRLALVPAQIHNADRGFIVLSPADGTGAIGTILRGTQPIQFYDHMGIMVEDYLTIRHCTESKDRLRDEFYYQGSVLGERVPTDGLRGDHVKYGWPGPITQSIDDAFYFGNNAGRNPEWDFYTLNPSEARVPPPSPGSKDDGTFWKRPAFYDPERPAGNDTGEGYTILNLALRRPIVRTILTDRCIPRSSGRRVASSGRSDGYAGY